MKKIRLLLATVAAATALVALPAPAQASHHCMPPDTENDGGLGHTLWVVCEYGPHDPVGVAQYVLCWLSPTC